VPQAVLRIGTLVLAVLAACDFSLCIGATGSHVPYKSLVELRAVYMPDATRAAIDLAHVDLTGGQQRPEQHGGGVGGRQHGLSFDPSLELLVQPLDRIGGARTAPLARRQTGRRHRGVPTYMSLVDTYRCTRVRAEGPMVHILPPLCRRAFQPRLITVCWLLFDLPFHTHSHSCGQPPRIDGLAPYKRGLGQRTSLRASWRVIDLRQPLRIGSDVDHRYCCFCL
jgi:hypothetical protein